ncbi:MAG: hypothetical protein DRJ07_02100 [Bacteroidetes bacterium]|nr:MAG: hypothetical protein DRJ07_02100 [Bacteroidota bacterium]
MKKHIIAFLFLLSSINSFSQINELGVFLGGSNYIGDIGSTKYIWPNNYAVGGIYKWNMSPHFTIRGTYTYAKVSGDDTKSGNSFREARGLSFTNTVHEVAAGIEYHFFKYSLSRIGYTQTPYIIVEAAVANYATRDDGRIFNFNIPFGIGYKTKLAPNVGIAFETSFRYTFKDDIDGYPTYANIDGEGNPVDPDGNIQINPNNNDWYVFTGITIVFGFGREGCYTGTF